MGREGKGRKREGGGGGGVGGFHGMISRSFLCLLASSPTEYIVCLCLRKEAPSHPVIATGTSSFFSSFFSSSFTPPKNSIIPPPLP